MSDKNPIIIGNWKMNTSLEEATTLIIGIRQGLVDFKEEVNVVICPPFVYLRTVDSILPKKVNLGAQNMFWEKKGAYTGEISPLMLSDIDCKYVIIGHSERRQNLGETDEMVNKKLKAALNNGIIPILCVGENEEEHEKKLSISKIKEQVEKALNKIEEKDIENLIIAYEPIWAIGTGKPALGKDAEKMAKLIKTFLADLYNEKIVEKVKIIYGGSVDANNIEEFIKQPNIEGALVGTACLKAEQFINIIKKAVK